MSMLLLLGLVTVALVADANEENTLDRSKLKAQLVHHEGKRSKVYLDTEKIPTIGVGFNLNRRDAKQRVETLGIDFAKLRSGSIELSDRQIESLLEEDINSAIKDCKSLFPELAELSDVRQRVLIDMTFNLGKARLSKFRKMRAAVKARDFRRAGEEMRDSKWYHQVKSRGKNLVSMMQTNKDVIKQLAGNGKR